MTVQTAAGSVISIGTTASDHLVDSYTAIGEVVTIPEFGRVYNLVTHNPIAARNTTKIKGSFNDGSVALDIGKDPNDAGQAAALVARESDLAYNFKLELNDAGPGTDDTPDDLLFHRQGHVVHDQPRQRRFGHRLHPDRRNRYRTRHGPGVVGPNLEKAAPWPRLATVRSSSNSEKSNIGLYLPST